MGEILNIVEAKAAKLDMSCDRNSAAQQDRQRNSKHGENNEL